SGISFEWYTTSDLDVVVADPISTSITGNTSFYAIVSNEYVTDNIICSVIAELNFVVEDKPIVFAQLDVPVCAIDDDLNTDKGVANIKDQIGNINPTDGSGNYTYLFYTDEGRT